MIYGRHRARASGCRLAYTNYAYTFEPRPPFRVLSLGRRPLRLRGERVRFVSGLARLGPFEEGDPLLGLSYGVDDRARCPHALAPPEHRPPTRTQTNPAKRQPPVSLDIRA